MVFLRSISVPCPYHPRTCTFKKLIVLLRTLNCIHMGKGLGLIGNFRGRVGNVIGYELKNSRDKVTQGLRQWQPYVKNPQTLPQIRQRAKLQNINNMYRALEPIISRGFETIEYGDKSRNHFMKLALTSESVPFTEKGSKKPVPADYIISEGSLRNIRIANIVYSGYFVSDAIVTYIRIIGDWSELKTMADFSRNILENNTYLQEGDQLTFLDITQSKNTFIYETNSIVLDTTDNNILDDMYENKGGMILAYGLQFTRLGQLYLMYKSENTGRHQTQIGGAVIVSRPLGEQRRLRSTTRIWFDESRISDYYSEAAMKRAFLSYMKQTWNRDWQEEPINK